MKTASAVAWAVCIFVASAPAAAQDKKAKPAQEEEFPRWTVQGVFSTDVSTVQADKGSRDSVPQEGIVGEYAIGATLYAHKGLTINVRTCYGCHEFHFHSAYADVELNDSFTLRVGRFPVPFGSMSRRVSPAQVESSTKPLPYIMGGMVRQREFNLGIVPAPFVDNGASVLSNLWLGPSAQVGIEAAVVRGLKGNLTDINYIETRDFEDNNGEPAGAARASLAAGPFTVGASAMYGRYDPDHELAYRVVGSDLHLKVGSWNLRGEFALRDTEFFVAFPSDAKDESRRTAYAIQVDGPLTEQWRVFVLQDHLDVRDYPMLESDDRNRIFRVVGGAIFSLRPGIHFKGSAEFWNLSDYDDTWVFHLGMVAEY